jgi:hypothetical protein
MHPLAEAQAVALLLEHPTAGWVHVFCDGSSLWSASPPNPAQFWDPGDVPESIACQRRSYHQARTAFAAAIKRLRGRGIPVG